MIVHISDTQKDLSLTRQKSAIRRIVAEVVDEEGIGFSQMGIFFVTEKKICSLHEKFFNDPSPTDCITFPIDGLGPVSEHAYLGDICICPQVALNIVEKKKGDPYKEITLYIIHGILHLLGYDDIGKRERQIMRRRESIHMKRLEALNLILCKEKK